MSQLQRSLQIDDDKFILIELAIATTEGTEPSLLFANNSVNAVVMISFSETLSGTNIALCGPALVLRSRRGRGNEPG